MNSELMNYLQQDSIGKVVARGLADLYVQKPAAPVKYLAAWLKTYSNNQKQLQKLSHQQSIKKDSLNIFQARTQEHAARKEEKVKEQKLHELKIQDFKHMIARHQYQQQLLGEVLPQFVEKQLGLTGAYIGYVNHPPKDITDEDQDQNAHLNTAIPKLINYIGSSQSHRQLMHGQQLALDKGVTGTAFSLSLDDPQPNEEGVVQAKEKYVYVGNVVRNQNIHYFRLPKLGAYIAVPLVYNSYLTENIFDAALAGRQKYLHDLEQFNTAKAAALKEIQGQKQAIEQRLADATAKADQTAIETAKAQIAQNQTKTREKQAQKFQDQNTQLQPQKREFVVCGDTLGLDLQIPESHRNLLLTLVKHFRDSWQAKQHQLLYRDVQYQVKIKGNLDRKTQQVLASIQKCLQIPAQKKPFFDQIEDEHLREYKKQQWQLQTLTAQFRDKSQYLASFFKLKNFRVVKFKELIQTILHFLQKTKKEINLPGKTILNWKHVRATILDARTFNQVISYFSEGPKTDHYPQYCKILNILAKLQKYDQSQVFEYNIGLGACLRLIKLKIAHRRANVDMRRAKKQKEREHRDAILQENQKLNDEKKAALEKVKQGMSEGQLEMFKEEQWSARYDEENPLKEEPAEVIDDIDNDY